MIEEDVEILRKEMETDVVSINKPLRKTVKNMTWKQLLANCHPIYREDYANKLVKMVEKKLIKPEDLL